MSLEWKRARRDETDLSRRRTWDSRCGRYRVQECIGKFTDMGTWYYAILLPSKILARKKKRNTAERVCERHVEPPKPRKSRQRRKRR